ncbi:GIY-YIG nuclease family protein [Microbacterium trichothecenolyticum]|uniref:GIY-YIG nuclease family protein n=1 Tax=Microbacterium trichothecenolyticum TaxID=69370 RepID=UPI0027E35E58|nr:GIY-YIG nuclease family protein [Microbacterium trichothecenolyticum]
MDDDGCRGPVPADAPVALCEAHLAAAGEWAYAHYGVADTLPSPCLLCGSRLGVRYPSGWLCGVCEWRYGDLPDDDIAPPRVDVVYYLRYDDRVKIGTSANPRQRFGAIWHDELLAFERGGRALEQRRHAQFAADRFGGTEWFRRSDALSAHIAALAAGVDDPWELHARWLSEALAARG